MTENDFEILSVGWDDYLMEWNNAGKYVKKIPNEEIDWKNQCNYCETGKWLGMETDYSELIQKRKMYNYGFPYYFESFQKFYIIILQ